MNTVFEGRLQFLLISCISAQVGSFEVCYHRGSDTGLSPIKDASNSSTLCAQFAEDKGAIKRDGYH